MTIRAMIVVDEQIDFVEGGALAVAGGKKVAADTTTYLRANSGLYVAVIGSQDFHDDDNCNGGHFAEPGTEPNYRDTWPRHCVAGTRGSNYADELDATLLTHHVRKGQGKPAYSAFEGITTDGRTVADLLTELGVTEVDIVGIATDHCVRATALDAAALGITTRVLLGMCAGVAEETIDKALVEMAQQGVVLDTSTAAVSSHQAS